MAEGGGCLRVNAENDARGEFTARLLDCQVKPPKKKEGLGKRASSSIEREACSREKGSESNDSHRTKEGGSE